MNIKPWLWASFTVVLGGLSVVSEADERSQTLSAPAGYYLAMAEGKGTDENSRYACESPPPPYALSLQFSSKYEGSDSSRDQLSEDAEQRYKNATADISLLEKESIKLAENYLEGNPGIASRDCLLTWLESWAKEDALLSTDSNHTGKSVRKWALASIASAYFSVKVADGAPLINDAQRQTIENWLTKLAKLVVDDWSNRSDEKRNNHDYWSAWSVMITGIVLNRQDLFDWANAGLRQGLAQINSDGFLPNELKRNTRALGYHNYALQPLVMLAVFAETNNATLTEAEREALTSLANVTVEGLNNPALFQQKTGAVQVVDGLATSYGLAWLEPYVRYFGQQALFSDYLVALRPMKSTRLGGDLTRIFKVNGSALAVPPKITEIKEIE